MMPTLRPTLLPHKFCLVREATFMPRPALRLMPSVDLVLSQNVLSAKAQVLMRAQRTPISSRFIEYGVRALVL